MLSLVPKKHSGCSRGSPPLRFEPYHVEKNPRAIQNVLGRLWLDSTLSNSPQIRKQKPRRHQAPAKSHEKPTEMLYLPPIPRFLGGRIPTHVPISKLNSAALAGIPVYATDSATDHRLVFVQCFVMNTTMTKIPHLQKKAWSILVSWRRYLLHLDSDATFNCRGV